MPKNRDSPICAKSGVLNFQFAIFNFQFSILNYSVPNGTGRMGNISFSTDISSLRDLQKRVWLPMAEQDYLTINEDLRTGVENWVVSMFDYIIRKQVKIRVVS